MTREEFIDAHWEEALVIDEKMREAAIACVKNFLGEDAIVESLLAKETWLTYKTPSPYFMHLAYLYSLKCLGERFLIAREVVEFLFMEMILDCSLGSAVVIVTIRDDFKKLSFSETIKKQKQNGSGRLQMGQEWTRVYFETFKKLPEVQSDLDSAKSSILRSLFLKLTKLPFGTKLPEEVKLEAREKEAEVIQVQIAEMAKLWGIVSLPEVDFEGWMFEEM